MGQMSNDAQVLLYADEDEDNINGYEATGTSRAMLANRLSYFFDFHGRI